MISELSVIWAGITHGIGNVKAIAFLWKCLRPVVRKLKGLFHRYAMEGLSTVEAPDPCFIGREKDIKALVAKMASSKYVVIHGAGGCGKSEMVKQYVSMWLKNYPGGCFQVDAAGLSKWKDVFLGLERRSTKDGVSAARIIGYNGVRRYQEERVSSDETLERWQLIRDDLLSAARNRGWLLLFLDNVDDVGMFMSSRALREAFQSGLAKDVKIKILVTARRLSSQVDENVEDLSLQDLSDEEAFEILRVASPRGLSSAEMQAARRIVTLLGGRALYMRRIPTLLNNDFTGRAYLSYAEVEHSLAACKDEVFKDLGDERCLPNCLWKLTREKLLQVPEKGEQCIKLAGIVSSLPENGADDDCVRWLWERLVEERKFADFRLRNNRFQQIKNILRKFHVLTAIDPVRMHPLDRDAIYETMRVSDVAFMDKVAQELSIYVGVSDRFWCFMSDRLDVVRLIDISSVSSRLAVILLKQCPEFSKNVNWAQLAGADWVRLLRDCPEYAVNCHWEKLNADGWARLLERRPEFADKCPFDSFSGGNWATVISRQPQFWASVDRKRLSTSDWARIVAAVPHLLDKCPLALRKRQFYSQLVSLNPSLYRLADRSQFRGGDWVRVLSGQPQFAQDCLWSRLNGVDICRLLSVRPEFADMCDLSKLNKKRWNKLVRRQPEKFKRRNLRPLSKDTWACLISSDIRYVESAPSVEFSASTWVRMLIENPALVQLCPFDQFDGADWCRLLLAKPRYVHRCDWTKLTQADRNRLIQGNPRFKVYMEEIEMS